jgi:hypothetical protein
MSQLITTAQVKTQAIVNSNLDTAYIDQYILFAQRKHLRDYLGKDFYDELLSENDTTFSSDNQILVDSYIIPCLAHYVVYESLPQVRIQIAKGGVFNNLSQTGDVASDLDYGRLRDDYLNKAEALKNEIDIYIKDQQDLDGTKFTLYCGKKSINGGIVFY